MKTINLIVMLVMLLQNMGPIPARQSAEAASSPELISQPVESAFARPTRPPRPTRTPVATPTATPMPTATPSPVAAVSLSLTAEPAYIMPGDKVSILWRVEGGNVEGEGWSEGAFLRFYAPEGFNLLDSSAAKIDSANGTMDLPIVTTSGKIGWMVSSDAGLPAIITAELWQGGEILAKGQVEISPLTETLIDASGGEVVGLDGQVRVKFPRGAAGQGLKVRIERPSAQALPVASLSGSPFDITAWSQMDGAMVSNFSEPITIEVSYIEGIWEGSEADTRVYWYDPEDGTWKLPLSQSINTETNVITVLTDHFTTFDTYNSNWQTAQTPTLGFFQTSTFTGAASFGMPIQVPAGPAGFAPDVSLSYNSQTVDSVSSESQASWAGMGWNVTGGGYIERFGRGSNGIGDDSFTLNTGGMSGELIPGADGYYHLGDENFAKVIYNPTAKTWKIIGKDGTQFFFDLIVEYNVDLNGNKEIWRWMLTKVKNRFGQEIAYTYATDTRNNGALITWVHPETITYSHSRYRVLFVRSTGRTDYKSVWTSGAFVAYQQTLLSSIRVEQDNNGDGTFETLIRKYKFTYASAPADYIFPDLVWDMGGKTPTLKSVQECVGDGAQEQCLPGYTFDYSVDHMHLSSATNGYGGTVTFGYNAWHDSEGGNPRKFEYRTDKEGWSGTYDGGSLRFIGTAQYTSLSLISIQPGRYYKAVAWVKPVTYYTTTFQLGFDYTVGGTPQPYMSTPVPVTNPLGNYVKIESEPFLLPVGTTKVTPKMIATGGQVKVDRYYLVPLPTYSRATSKMLSTSGQNYTWTYEYTNPRTNDPATSAVAALPHPYTKPYTEFRGHQQVKETDPYGTETVTTFGQSDCLSGSVLHSQVQKGGVVFQESAAIYDCAQTESANPPIDYDLYGGFVGQPFEGIFYRWVRPSSQTSTIYPVTQDGVGGTMTTAYTYETTYGNLTDLTTSGDVPTLTTHIDYDSIINLSQDIYIVGLPLHTVVTGAGGRIAESFNIYATVNGHPGILVTARQLMTADPDQYSQADFSYDTWGNVTGQTVYSGYWMGAGDAIGTPSGARTLTTAYDPTYHTYPTSLTTPPVAGFPSGLTTNLTYNYTLGVPTSETGPNGSATTVSAEYDDFGRLIKLIRPGDDSASPTLRIEYSTSPFTVTLTQKVEPGQFFTATRQYDGLGRPTSATAGGVTTLYQYGFENGQRMDKVSAPNSSTLWVKTVYDALGRPISVTTPDGNTTTSAYGGLKTKVTDANQHQTTTIANMLGQTISVDAPDGPDLAFEYNDLGALKTATRGSQPVTMNYDIAGRKTSMDDPDMGHWTYEYDALGNLKYQTDARGCLTTLQYDNLNRLTNKSYSNCPSSVAPTASVTYGYDAHSTTNFGIGFRTSMSDGSGSTTWMYDERGRAASENKTIGAQSFLTQWTYNRADQLTSMTYPDGEVVKYQYDSRMLLNKVFNDMGTPGNPSDDINYVPSITYDSIGRLDTRTLGNGLTQNYHYYNWDEKVLVDGVLIGQGGRLETLTTGSLQNLAYVYDSVGNVAKITNSAANETSKYGYDPLNRLTSWQLNENPVVNYNYNAAGNLIEKGDLDLEYNDTAHIHAVTDAGSNSYDYDQNGNQTHRLVHTIVNGQPVTQEFEMGYDAENRLVSVTGVGGTTTSALFTYNGDGQKVKSVINGETILLIGGHYEVLNPGTGQTVTKYYFAGGSRIAMRKYTIPQSMTVEYFLGDHLGSTSITTDNTGAKVSEMRYEPWGEIRYSWTSGQSTTPAYKLPVYTFTGQRSYMDDPSTSGMEGFGLMDYNARMYDPQVGRFTSADTVVPGGVQGLDRYAYVNNSPVMYVDPSGHAPNNNDPYWCGNARNPGQCRRDWYVGLKNRQDLIEAILSSAVYVGFVGYGETCLDNAAGEACYEPLSAGLGTVLGNMSTIVTAYHIYAESLRLNRDIAYIKIENANGDVVRISLSDVTLERVGDSDVLIIHLKNPLPDGFAKPAEIAENYHPRRGQVIYTVYQEGGKLYVASTMIDGPLTYYKCGYGGGICLMVPNPNATLNAGDSGGGVFYNGQFIGVNSSIFNKWPFGPTLLISPYAF